MKPSAKSMRKMIKKFKVTLRIADLAPPCTFSPFLAPHVSSSSSSFLLPCSTFESFLSINSQLMLS